MHQPNPILLLHGALGNSEDLTPLKEFLEAQGLNVFTMDFGGHGKTSPMPSDFRVEAFAQEVERFLKTKQLEDVVVFGHSLGGYVALFHAAHFDDSPIGRIVTYGTKFNWTASAVARELPMFNPDHLLAQFPMNTQLLFDKHGERWKHLVRSVAHMMQNLEKLDGLTKEDMTEVDIPVTLLLGDQDKTVSSEETQIAASWLPQGEVRTVSHSKHDLERTNLKEVGQILLELLE